MIKKATLVIGFLLLYIVGSSADAYGLGGFSDKSAAELSISYDDTWGDDSFAKYRTFNVVIETSTHSCTMTCIYEDNLFNDYDAVKIPNCDAAQGMVASALVWNSEGESSGYTSDVTSGLSSNKKSVEHVGSATRWRMFIAEDLD